MNVLIHNECPNCEGDGIGSDETDEWVCPRCSGDGIVEDVEYVFTCHLCQKEKRAPHEVRALYLLAFHYDRRHRGWTE